jgi:hypothetical protein
MSDRVKIGHHDLDVKQKASIYSVDIIGINFHAALGALRKRPLVPENLKNDSFCKHGLIMSTESDRFKIEAPQCKQRGIFFVRNSVLFL